MRLLETLRGSRRLLLPLVPAFVIACDSNSPDPSAPDASEARAAATTPGQATDLTVEATSADAVVLSFTEVDNGVGGAASYQIRYADTPLGWGWGSATVVTEGSCAAPLKGSTVGATLQCTVEGLASEHDYDFQMVAYRGSLNSNANFGGLSNVASGSTTAEGSLGGSLSLSPPSSTLHALGATTTLTATATDATGEVVTGATIAWSSTDAGVATVNDGLVTAVARGTARIVASASCCGADTATVTVDPRVASVLVTPGSASLTVGDSTRLDAEAVDANGQPVAGARIQWLSSDASVADVSAGMVKAMGSGSTSVMAISENAADTAAVTVTQPAPPGGDPGRVSDLRVTGSGANSLDVAFTEVGNGAGGAASYQIRYAASPIGWGWGSATVVSQGSCASPLKGAGAGKTLTCTVAGLQSDSQYDLQIVAYRGTMSDGNAVFGGISSPATGTTGGGSTQPGPVGAVSDLRVSGNGQGWVDLSFTQVDDGTGAPADYQVRYQQGSISWGQATVANSGTCASPVDGTAVAASMTCRVSGLSSGTAYQLQVRGFRGTLGSGSVTWGGTSNAVSATTACTGGSIDVSPDGGSVDVGSTLSLSATARDCTGSTVSNPGMSWGSSNASVATVSGSGTVTGRAAGIAWIRANASCCSADSVQVSVNATTPPPSGSTAWPNMPSGMNVVADDPMTSHPSRDWGYAKRDAEWTLQSVSTPSGEGKAVAVHYPNGFRDGLDPGVYYTSVNGATRLYYGYTLKLQDSYDMPGNGAGSGGGQKFGMFPFENGGGTNLFALLKENGSGQHELWANFNGGGGTGGDGFLEANATSNPVKFQPGTWYRIEWYVQLGRGNGIVRAWVSTWNGSSWGSPQKQLEYTNLDFGSVTSFGEAQLDFTWGGGAGNKTQNDYIYIDATMLGRN